eukprot:353226-Chlamydomonas_euryale.AAC.9
MGQHESQRFVLHAGARRGCPVSPLAVNSYRDCHVLNPDEMRKLGHRGVALHALAARQYGAWLAVTRASIQAMPGHCTRSRREGY